MQGKTSGGTQPRSWTAVAFVLAVVVGLAAAAPSASAATRMAEAPDRCSDLAAAKTSERHDVTADRDATRHTEYLVGGSYRVTDCAFDGRLVRSITAEPHRLPTGELAWLPHEVTAPAKGGLASRIADYGDFDLYDGDWRKAVEEASSLVPPPPSPSKLTETTVPDRGPNGYLHSPEGADRSSRSSSDPRCSQGGYSFDYYFKTSANHQINLSMIGVVHHPAFIENINEGFNTWQYTYNVCGFTPVNGVTASTTGFTSTPAGVNDGIEVVDAGPLTTGSCAGAIACAFIWPDLKHDVRMSTAYPYCVGWCVGHYDIWSVMAHEAGHVYGFGHNSTPGMVMYPYISTNDAGNRYLWWGDYLGLGSTY